MPETVLALDFFNGKGNKYGRESMLIVNGRFSGRGQAKNIDRLRILEDIAS
jgi:hypothetical protein